jgi:hypothetical protein
MKYSPRLLSELSVQEISGGEVFSFGLDSYTTTAGHTPFVNPRCCEYSLIELLMKGVGFARNMYSDLQEIIKYYTKCHLVGT